MHITCLSLSARPLQAALLKSSYGPKPPTRQKILFELSDLKKQLRFICAKSKAYSDSFELKQNPLSEIKLMGLEADKFCGEIVTQACNFLLTHQFSDLRLLTHSNAQSTYTLARWFINYLKNEPLINSTNYPQTEAMAQILISRRIKSISVICERIFIDYADA